MTTIALRRVLRQRGAEPKLGGADLVVGTGLCAVVLVAYVMHLFAWWTGGAALLVGFMFLRLQRRPDREVEHDVTLGSDGLLLPDTFIPRADIRGVERTADSCVLLTYSGERIELRGTPLALTQAAKLAEALLATRDLPRDQEGERLVTALAAIRSPVMSASSYREPAFGVDRAIAILNDSRAPPRARIAAATLLAERCNDGGGRLRIETVLADTANTEVQEGLRAFLESG